MNKYLNIFSNILIRYFFNNYPMKRHYDYVHFTDEKQRPREVKYFPRVTQLVNRRIRNPEPYSVLPHSVVSLCGFRFYWADTQEAVYIKFLTLKNPLWLMSSFPLKTSTQGQFPSSSSFQDGSSKWPSQDSREISRTNICINWRKTGTPLIPALPTPIPVYARLRNPILVGKGSSAAQSSPHAIRLGNAICCFRA